MGKHVVAAKIKHETNGFNRILTTLEHFREHELQTGAAVADFYRARVLVESAEPAVARAAMTAAVAQMQALQDRRALVPSTRYALIEEGRRLLLTLN